MIPNSVSGTSFAVLGRFDRFLTDFQSWKSVTKIKRKNSSSNSPKWTKNVANLNASAPNSRSKFDFGSSVMQVPVTRKRNKTRDYSKDKRRTATNHYRLKQQQTVAQKKKPDFYRNVLKTWLRKTGEKKNEFNPLLRQKTKKLTFLLSFLSNYNNIYTRELKRMTSTSAFHYSQFCADDEK